ncbi:MAG: excinuclease ABC subunit UvrA [Mycoplasmataceae bacterium]|nr:excinuclease ABC subunit UvrA [Mycoplasmataceae bacterium]
MSNKKNKIVVVGARENNLKNININIPKNKLVVLTGVSGSGKSSLAFNTIYEEGRRRYVDSLSSYARQFLGSTQKPLVESIDGLSPAISIEQKTTHNNPRSTVGTVTEVYDYLRLLYARIGKAFCPRHKVEIKSQTTSDILNDILKLQFGSKIIILSPIVIREKGTHQNLFTRLSSEGFLRVKVNGSIFTLDDEIKLDKNKVHNISIVVDRIVINKDIRSRLVEAVELALEYGKGLVNIEIVDDKIKSYSKFHSCPEGDFNMPLLEPRLFSFNSPSGMCESCKGLGVKLNTDKNKLFLNKKQSINQGGIVYFKNLIGSTNLEWQEFKILCDHYKIDLNTAIEDMNKEDIEIIMYGSKDEIQFSITSSSGIRRDKISMIEGIADKIERKYMGTSSEMIRKWYRNTYMSDVTCNKCKGSRLNDNAMAVKIGEMNIFEFTKQSIESTLENVLSMELDDNEKQISELIINELADRLSFLNNVGLDYLSLDRKAETLSGGESQRIRLATQIGSNLTGVLYVLDEPSIGLHQKDNAKLIKTLKHMVESGNTLMVVEHDEETIRSADYIIDIGPGAGEDGGEIVAQGTLEQISKSKNSLTGDYLSGRKKIEIPLSRRSGNGKVFLVKGAKENNLSNIDVKIPLGKLISVTGVSGSGKSTLVNEIIYKSIQQKISNPFIVPGKVGSISGIEYIDKLIRVSQSPIGRTPRSNPATYTSVFDDIRDVFSKTQVSRARGYLKGRFSFNVDGGRCEKCRGDGTIKIELHFLPNVYVKCEQCEGRRYNLETLESKYKNKSIADVLDMRVSEAVEFFSANKKITDKLMTLMDVGLGYITLGQSATTLSGGEAQRVKLATFLQKKPTGKTLYILDEPTTGLHQHDISKLINVLNRIVDDGDTVLVIEHNLDMIKVSDYIIDLGPGGGIKGGKVIATGTPEQVSKTAGTYTGEYLETILFDKK